MSKYDFELDLSQNSSTGLLLGKINKGDVVLEFGCAAGRMTRYMQQELGCKVYIVEYEKSAFETALQYAEDGVCGDILKFEWYEKFKDIKFDAILFADVLEHLTRPEIVVQKAAELMAENGHIYISVPNITHNDILLKAYSEHFDYTSIGLLDDTHIHFWGFENIKKFQGKYGINIEKIEATYCETQNTEQYYETPVECNLLLKNILKERKCGEVYQFIVTLSKTGKPCEDEVYDIKPSIIRSHLYIDNGSGFTSDNIISFESVYSGDGSYTADYIIENTDDIKRIRFDPVEGQGCFVRNITLSQNGKNLKWISSDCFEYDGGFFILNEDPMFTVDEFNSGIPFSLHAEIIIAGSRYIEYLCKAYNELYSGSQKEIQSINEKNAVKVNQLTAEYTKTIDRLNEEKSELERRIAAYINIANNKDKLIIEQERYIGELKHKAAYLERFKIVKCYRFVKKVCRKIKNKLKRILG